MPNKLKVRPSKTRMTDVYSIAHTAQCKLSMTASDPDRNLRFILGHAFLLDNMLLRVAKIEEMDDLESGGIAKNVLNNDDDIKAITQTEEEPPEGQSGSLAGGRVKFHNDKQHVSTSHAQQPEDNDDHDRPQYSDEEREYDDGNDDDGATLSLQRFSSASAQPPRMVQDSSSSSDEDEDEEEPITPPSLPADFDYKALISESDQDAELSELYEQVRGCPCHGNHQVEKSKSQGVWNVKGAATAAADGGLNTDRVAVIKVDA